MLGLAVVAMLLFASRPARAFVAKGAHMMTLEQLRELARLAGFPESQVDVAAAVAMAESGGNPLAVGDHSTSFGLWQVNTPSHPQYDASKLLDAEYNAHAAFAISQAGADWSPWTTFRTGAYKKYMPGGGGDA
jgi:Lysozyme like domain